MIEKEIAGIFKNSEFDLGDAEYMLNQIFVGFGRMGEPIADIIEEIKPQIGFGKYTTFKIRRMHARHEDKLSSGKILSHLTKAQLGLVEEKNEQVKAQYESSLSDWTRNTS
ncbi:MAG: hypothetical protein WA152_00310 [Microgenomates group bacterium]